MKYKMMSIGNSIYGKKGKNKDIGNNDDINEIREDNKDNDKINLINTDDEDNINENLINGTNNLKDKYGDIENVEFNDINKSFYNDMKKGDSDQKNLINEFLL